MLFIRKSMCIEYLSSLFKHLRWPKIIYMLLILILKSFLNKKNVVDFSQFYVNIQGHQCWHQSSGLNWISIRRFISVKYHRMNTIYILYRTSTNNFVGFRYAWAVDTTWTKKLSLLKKLPFNHISLKSLPSNHIFSQKSAI